MGKTLEDKLKAGRQYRSAAALTLDESGEEYIAEGYATAFEERYTIYRDSDMQIDEQIARGAFDECDMSDVIMQYDHQGRVYARTGNKTLTLETDDKGLKIRAYLGGTESGRNLYEEIKGGYTCKMSFGFTVESDRTERTGTESGRSVYLRTITKIGKLYDVSAVSLPANDATEISARNFANGVIRKVEAERLEQEERAAKIEKLKKMNRKETKNGN